MPLPYYERLSRRNKAIYRQSDRIAEVRLPDAAALRPLATAVRDALAADDRVAVERTAASLVRAMLQQLEVPPVSVRVMAVRPSHDWGELHGLYTFEEGKRPTIQVWMRTAAQARVVQFRTFLRTLLHEVCHHLDYTYFELDDSFHTEGFFRRESSLMRQLVLPRSRAASQRSDGEPSARARTHAKRGSRTKPRAAAAATARAERQIDWLAGFVPEKIERPPDPPLPPARAPEARPRRRRAQQLALPHT